MDKDTGRPLPPLAPGDQVHIQDASSNHWTTDGVVVGVRPSGRSYDIRTSGGIFPCNRRFIRLASQLPENDPDLVPLVPEFVGAGVVIPKKRRSSRVAAT